MPRKKKDIIEQNDIKSTEVVKEQITEQDNKENKQNKDIIIHDTRTLEQKLQSYKRKLRRI